MFHTKLNSVVHKETNTMPETRSTLGQPATSTLPTSSPVSEHVTLRVKDFNAWYGAYQALHNITMDIPSQRVTSLIGPSGCGKSTFLRWINRMNDLVPNARAEGVMQLDQDDLLDRNFDVVELRRRVGMVFKNQIRFQKAFTKISRLDRGFTSVFTAATWTLWWSKACAPPPFGTK